MPEFQRTVGQQIQNGERRSPSLDGYPTVIRSWKRRYEAGALAAVIVKEDVVPARQLRERRSSRFGSSSASASSWPGPPRLGR